MIKLSVLVTFYNQEEFVDRAMESIFKQKVNFPFEVIVGDDGSSDSTCDKVKAWQKKYPGIISLYVQPREERKYLSGERASGNRLNILQYVQGKYFMYLDGDDCYCDNSKFQKQVDALEANPDCSCCGHNVEFVCMNETASVLKTWFGKSAKISFSRYWWKGYFHPDSLMFRSENIKQNVDYSHPLFFNDNYITYVFAHPGKLLFLEDVMAKYFEMGNGIWNGQSKIVGWIRTATIYEYLMRKYRKHRLSSFFRFVPMYYLILKHSDELKSDKAQRYLAVAEENEAKKVARLKDCGTAGLAILKLVYTLLYVTNACLKRLF